MPRVRTVGTTLPTAPRRKSNFEVIEVAELSPVAGERKLSPRQLEMLARQKTITELLNDAAAQPASKAVVWDFGKQSPANVRNALKRVVDREPRGLYAAFRGARLVVSKSKLPGRSIFLGGTNGDK